MSATTDATKATKATKETKAKRARENYKASRDEGDDVALPKKKFYRQRAHANPFSDHSLN
jgi:tRNA (guanine-N7-)-methyltransferase